MVFREICFSIHLIVYYGRYYNPFSPESKGKIQALVTVQGNSSAQDFALAAKSVRARQFSQERICPSPKAIWNGQIP